MEVAVLSLRESVVGFEFVEVLALRVEPVDVLEENAQASCFWLWLLYLLLSTRGLCTAAQAGLY